MRIRALLALSVLSTLTFAAPAAAQCLGCDNSRFGEAGGVPGTGPRGGYVIDSPRHGYTPLPNRGYYSGGYGYSPSYGYSYGPSSVPFGYSDRDYPQHRRGTRVYVETSNGGWLPVDTGGRRVRCDYEDEREHCYVVKKRSRTGEYIFGTALLAGIVYAATR